MSVVAGCSLLNGVLLAADCRATIKRHPASDVHVDTVQKIFGVLPHTAIGFVGDIGAAGFMLYHLLIQARRKKKSNPRDLLRWFPRFLRRSYADYRPKGRGKGDVYFMGASVLAGEPNVIERQAFVDMMEDIRLGKMTVNTSSLPNIFFDALKLDRRYSHIKMPDTSRGLLYVMRPPLFEVEHYSPLQIAAIGSGGQVIVDLEGYRNVIFGMSQGDTFAAVNLLRRVIRGFTERHCIESVGGLLPAFKVTAQGIEVHGYKMEIPVGGTRITLAYENGRMVQNNLTTGKKIPLLLPWELDFDKIRRDIRFDDLDDAFKKFREE